MMTIMMMIIIIIVIFTKRERKIVKRQMYLTLTNSYAEVNAL